MRNEVDRKAEAIILFVSVIFPIWMLASGGLHARLGFPLDDAWIHMVYGRAIAQGGYLAYNPGIPSTGSTSPLWAYLLGLGHLLFPGLSGAVLAAKVLGIIFHVWIAVTAYRIVLLISELRLAAFAAGILIGGSPPLAASAISGMEVSFGCATALTGLYLYFRKKWLPAGILLGLSGLIRPEFGAVVLIVWADAAREPLHGKLPWRDLTPLFIPPLIAGAIFFGWNLWAGGLVFPSSFYVKVVPQVATGLVHRLGNGVRIIIKDSPLAPGIAWIGLLFPFIFRARERRKVAVCFGAGAAYFLGNILVILPLDIQAYYYIRYLLPSMALLSVAVLAGWACGIQALHESLAHAPPRKARLKEICGLAVVGVTAILLVIKMTSGAEQWRLKYARDCRNIDEVQVALGKDIAAAFDPSSTIGTTDAGAVRYFGKRFTVDLLGINTKEKLSEIWTFPPLDAMIVFPSWIKVPRENPLVIIDERTTADYRVTRNPNMGVQVILVGRSERSREVLDLRLVMLGVKESVRLNGMTRDEIELLKGRLPR